jgi:hypothetical protein
MQVRDATGCKSVDELNNMLDGFDSDVKSNYSMIEKQTLNYDDMERGEVLDQIVEAVRQYNDFFSQLCDDIHVADRFLVDNRSLQKFRELVNKDLKHHLLNGWQFATKDLSEKNGSDPIEDTVFFYPIIGSIRNNLIENL